MNFCMQTFSGEVFDFSDIQNAPVNIIDIAHALSMTCRFNGHISKFYSVAEHSYIIAKALIAMGALPITALFGLLHDGSEAYLNDIVRPAKGLIKGYKEIEADVQDRIESQLITQYVKSIDEKTWKNIHTNVKKYDMCMLLAEKEAFFPIPMSGWESAIGLPKHTINLLYDSIKCLPHTEIEYKFLMLYYKLKNLII